MYHMEKDTYECDFCGFEQKWNDSDDVHGECRFAMVHERKPRITDEDGCIDFDYQEGEC